MKHPFNAFFKFNIRYMADAGDHVEGDGDGGGGGGGTPPPPDWRTQIPAALMNEPIFANVKDVGDMAQQFYNANKLIGVDKLARPKPDWKPEQWNEFYKAVGRPEEPTAYSKPPQEVVETLSLDEKALGTIQSKFFSLGLTEKQASELLSFYAAETKAQVTGLQEQMSNQQNMALQELRSEFKDDFDSNMDIVHAVVTKFGDKDFGEFLEVSKLGNDPRMVRTLLKVGKAMLEDGRQAPAGGNRLEIHDATSAKQEIGKLRLDTAFMNQLVTRNVMGHKEAVAKWEELHRKAYPQTKNDAG